VALANGDWDVWDCGMASVLSEEVCITKSLKE
jgi:hypothetical protein